MTETPILEPGNLGELRRLTLAVTEKVATLPALQPVQVDPEFRGDIEADIRNRLGQLGLHVLVLSPVPRTTKPLATHCPILDSVGINIQVAEKVLINHGKGGTGMHALDVAEYILVKLQNTTWTDGNAATRVLTMTEQPIEYVPTPAGFLADNIYVVRFTTTVTPRDPFSN